MLQVTVLCLLLGSSLTVSRSIIDETEESSGNEEDELSVSALLERANKNLGESPNGPRVTELDIAVEYDRPKNISDENENLSGDEEDELSVSALLERANKNLGESPDAPELIELDIAVGYGLQNADPCTSSSCKWPKSRDGLVYVPYTISRQYSNQERNTIEQGLRSFAERQLTCIRFIPRTNQRDYLSIQSLGGCWSYIGRRRGAQRLSLDRRGCVSKKIIQHEMMHALGFHHEQSRSDRDQHVAIQWQNIERNNWSQFNLVQTNNLGTPYDYNSIMQYRRDAFSKNGRPTIVPIPNRNAVIGEARQMSNNDILRINRLYC